MLSTREFPPRIFVFYVFITTITVTQRLRFGNKWYCKWYVSEVLHCIVSYNELSIRYLFVVVLEERSDELKYLCLKPFWKCSFTKRLQTSNSAAVNWLVLVIQDLVTAFCTDRMQFHWWCRSRLHIAITGWKKRSKYTLFHGILLWMWTTIKPHHVSCCHHLQICTIHRLWLS